MSASCSGRNHARLLRRAWLGEDWITCAGWATLAVVVSLPWEMPWYVLWVPPTAPLGRSASMGRAGVVLPGRLLTHACRGKPRDTETGKQHDV